MFVTSVRPVLPGSRDALSFSKSSSFQVSPIPSLRQCCKLCNAMLFLVGNAQTGLSVTLQKWLPGGETACEKV